MLYNAIFFVVVSYPLQCCLVCSCTFEAKWQAESSRGSSSCKFFKDLKRQTSGEGRTWQILVVAYVFLKQM